MHADDDRYTCDDDYYSNHVNKDNNSQQQHLHALGYHHVHDVHDDNNDVNITTSSTKRR